MTFFNVYTMVVCLMSMDIILLFDIDDKTISIAINLILNFKLFFDLDFLYTTYINVITIKIPTQ